MTHGMAPYSKEDCNPMKRLLSRLRGMRSPMRMLFDEARLAQDIRRSLYFILMGNICGNFFGIICGTGTTAMIGLANDLGAGDLTFGILNGLGSGLALMQIPFAALVSRTQKRKKYMLTYGLFSRALWLLFGLIPFLVPGDPDWLQITTLLFLVGISGVAGASINVCWMPWLADLAPIRIRGRWLSIRDAFNSVGGVIFGLLVAYMLDHIASPLRYLVIFLIGGTFGVLDMCCFAFAKEVYSAPPAARRKKEGVLRQILGDAPFLRFLIFWTAWCFTSNLSGAYLTRYAMNEMGLTNFQVTLFGTIAASLVTVLVVSRWGRLLDRFGCKPVMMVAGLAAALTPGFFLLSTPGSILPMLLHNVLGAFFWSATNLAATNMQFTYSPDAERASYIAYSSCITALEGPALGMVSGGALLEWFAAWGNFDRYKALILLSVILRFAVVWILVPGMQNDREGSVRGMFRFIFRHKPMDGPL